MIRECWQFNYMFDVDFLMSQFDEDVRSLVTVKVVHGSWRKESPNRMMIDEGCSRYPNVEPIVAYMPDPFGTHHSKMMILLRHDDLAQIVIHTANMIPGDWTNMTQAVWQSPLLPLSKLGDPAASQTHTKIGAGARFKRDIIAYLKAYGPNKTGKLVQQLQRYDFSAVRAALVASVPSRQKVSELDSKRSTLWGWPALKDLMGQVPIHQQKMKTAESQNGRPHIVTQVSSVATLGQTDKWLKEVFFKALSQRRENAAPKHSIIFPTPDEIRRSLNGYSSGGSIHMKTQSASQQKQLQYIRPYLCQWAGDSDDTSSNIIDLSDQQSKKQEAGRGRAAPHIKTYIQFSDAEKMDTIDWAMVTSANLSTQAWGAATNPNGEVRIQSFEIGVVVWPDLFADDSAAEDEQSTIMVPCFKRDQPSLAGTGSNKRNYRQLLDFVCHTIFLSRHTLPLMSHGVQLLLILLLIGEELFGSRKQRYHALGRSRDGL
ncbi:Tyrosyl-DNA phosphodiesterase [Penicillium hetheringtonii]|uniref:Tyrosyl-DNA phosphodiesterase n=1 Tax=Penicillium hetheringtonii TaxID=911720 RepID=A0AAD6H0E8_9EURO|nr:Tyrosyl-DNA phosphodiesterase [Penicillium hetheringtonii]